MGAVLHVLVWSAFGVEVWSLLLGWPLLCFAWVYSVLVYIYHYKTTYGVPTQHNVRSLDRHWFFSWWLLNFNEHTTHHADPNIAWQDLPNHRSELPESHRSNQNVNTVWEAVFQLAGGPNIVTKTLS